MQEELFDNDLGLDLLMNPKKKAFDNISVISSGSARSSARPRRDSDIMSVKSVNIKPEVVVVDQYNQSVLGDDFDGTESRKSSKSSAHSSYSGSIVSDDITDMESTVSRRSRRSHKSHSSQQSHIIKTKTRHVSEEEILNAKREYLYQFDRLEKKGFKLPRKFTLASSLEDMKQEFERLRRDKDIDGSIKFQRKTMITIVSGIELVNNFFDPIGAKLDGWSENINENIDDYDDVFEELHEKYKGKAKIAPELKLLFMLGGSAFMFHMTNCMFKSSSMPGLDEVLKQNPELAKQFAAATANTMAQNKSNPMMSGLGGMFSSMFGGGGNSGPGGIMAGISSLFGGGNQGNQQSPQQPYTQPRSTMKGPSNVDDLLREVEGMTNGNDNDNDRIEVFSTVTESEMTDFADDASINNLLMNKKKGGRRKMTLDI
jgi:hypothetical protein